MNFKSLFLLSISLICISCATTEQASTTRVLDIYGSGVLQMPVVGELDVDINKVMGTASASGTSANTDRLKIIAINQAVKSVNADILIEPSFEIKKEGIETVVVVSGFPATYSNFRPVTPEDVPLLEIGQLQKASVFETSEEVQQEDRPTSNLVKVAAFLGGVSLVAILAIQLAP